MELQNDPINTSVTPSEEVTAAVATHTTEPTEASEPTSTPQNTRSLPSTKEEVIEATASLAQLPAEEISREEVNRLKVQFHNLRHDEVAAEKAAWAAQEHAEGEEFTPAADAQEEAFKAALYIIKEKKAELAARQAAEKLDNLLKKNAIIEELLRAADDTDNVHRHLDQVRELRKQFKEIGEVPEAEVSAIWKRYQSATENFYDQLKVNMDLRDLDFKKNLELKTLLITEAEALQQEEDIVAAFGRAQDLQQKWREIGPVAKELREEIWNKFKDLTAEIYKKYQAFFEERKAQERQNEEAKQALIARLEAISLDSLINHAAWEDATKQVIAAQEEWKQVGFASRKVNADLFKRFRAMADNFFAAKAAYFKGVKNEYAENLAKKITLCEQAEELSQSTDWKKAADALMELQTKWKTIGAVARKESDAVWTRFRAACDAFFERKKANDSETRHSETANLKAKRDVVEQLKAIQASEGMDRKAEIAKVRELMAAYQAIGHVPFREKDKLHEAYRAEVSRLYETLDMNNRHAREQAFEQSVEALAGNERELSRQRERIVRSIDMKRQEIKTFENNLGFFNSKSKSGESMLRDMQARINRLHGELTELQQKLALVTEKLNG